MPAPQPERRQLLKAGALVWTAPVIAVASAAPAYATSASNLSTSTVTVRSPQKPIAVDTVIRNSGTGPTTALKVTVTAPNAVSATQVAPDGWTVQVTGPNTVVFTAADQLPGNTNLAASFVVERGNNGAGTVTVVIDPGGGGLGTTQSFTI